MVKQLALLAALWGGLGLASAGGALTGGTSSSGSSGLTSPVGISDGGTGQTSAANAINALLPSQGSANGKYLTSNGSASSWGTVTAGDVSGPASSTSFALARFADTTGKLLLNSPVNIANTSGNILYNTDASGGIGIISGSEGANRPDWAYIKTETRLGDNTSATGGSGGSFCQEKWVRFNAAASAAAQLAFTTPVHNAFYAGIIEVKATARQGTADYATFHREQGWHDDASLTLDGSVVSHLANKTAGLAGADLTWNAGGTTGHEIDVFVTADTSGTSIWDLWVKNCRGSR